MRPGERVTLRATVLETRASRSRSDLGFVKFRFELFDASDKLLMILTREPDVRPAFRRRAGARGTPSRS